MKQKTGYSYLSHLLPKLTGKRDPETAKNIMFRRVITAYFDVMWEQVLAGFKIEFPCNFGNLAIYKVEIGKNPGTGTIERRYKNYKFEGITHRYGCSYLVRLFSPKLIKARYEFKPSIQYAARLSKILRETFIEYRSIDEYDQQVSEHQAIHPGSAGRYWS